MRSKTQMLVQNNFNAVKMAMLTGKDPAKLNAFGIDKEPRQANSAIEHMRKRKRDLMEVDRAEPVLEGSFRYTYFQGQTKNIRRPLSFAFFL